MLASMVSVVVGTVLGGGIISPDTSGLTGKTCWTVEASVSSTGLSSISLDSCVAPEVLLELKEWGDVFEIVWACWVDS